MKRALSRSISTAIAASLALTVGLSGGLGCLVPPRGEPIESSRGPVIDRSRVINAPSFSVTIRAGTLETNLDDVLEDNCVSQIFSLEGVLDRDSDQLLFRWVANNGLEGAAVLDEGDERRAPDDPEEPFDFEHTLLLPGPYEDDMRRAAFREGGGNVVAFLDLFITDASSWSAPAASPPPDNDFARIPSGGDGSVAGISWTITFERGPCS
jgi:hypothetical protein